MNDRLAKMGDALGSEAINSLARELFQTIVGLPSVVAVGQGLLCPVKGKVVVFSTLVARAAVADTPAAVVALAKTIRAEAVSVGAVKLHTLTPCTVEPIATGAGAHTPAENVLAEHYKHVEAYWDGLFECADGSLHSPRPAKTIDRNPVWVDDTTGGEFPPL